MSDEELIRRVMSLLGSRKTAKKSAAGRANMQRLNVNRVRSLKPCTCGGEPHRYSCPVYAREATRRSRAKKEGK